MRIQDYGREEVACRAKGSGERAWGSGGAYHEELAEVLDEAREEARDAEHDEHRSVRQPHTKPVGDGPADDADDDGEGDGDDGGGGRVVAGDADAAAAHADAAVVGRAYFACLVSRQRIALSIREYGEAVRADVATRVRALRLLEGTHQGRDGEPHEEADEEREGREPGRKSGSASRTKGRCRHGRASGSAW